MNDARNTVNGRYESKGIENVIEWVTRCNPDMEYVDGFIDFDSPINVRCTKCGDVFPRSMGTIRHGRKTHCKNCTRIAQGKRAEARQEQIEKDKRLRHEAVLQRRTENKRLLAESRRHDCPVCGASTTRKKYCSEACLKKANNATHEASRRIKIERNLVDKDITLKRLYTRDKGVCWVCGLVCDYQDKTYRGRTMIAGDMYPSIDHVVALSDGGAHAWDNVKLAHRICNSLRYYIPVTI